MEKEGLDILKMMERVTRKKSKGEEHFKMLEEIFNHISKHKNEPPDQRAESIKKIIDTNWKGSDD